MTKEINEIQQKIGILFHEMLPTPYSRACMFIKFAPDKEEPEFRFCYVDAASDKLIPDDHICDRNDITVDDPNVIESGKKLITENAKELRKKYLSQLEDQWYTMTYEIKGNGKFSITFDHELTSDGMQVLVNKWCMKNLGRLPEVTIDVLK